jgi:hypothetical protein
MVELVTPWICPFELLNALVNIVRQTVRLRTRISLRYIATYCPHISREQVQHHQ